ncbi:MAG: aldose 1-epimerase [Bryobacteraceae bacterium]
MRANLSAVVALAVLGISCTSKPPEAQKAPPPRFSAAETDVTVGGKKAVRLSQPQPADTTKPAILSADILPGRGMNTFQITAYVPGKGVINMLVAPPLDQASQLMNGSGDDQFGNGSFRAGGAILVPFANRIRGKLSPDKQSIETTIYGKQVSLPANSRGKKPHAEVHSMHGLILNKAFENVTLHSADSEATLEGTLDAGDFGGHWLSKSNVAVKATLDAEGFGFTVTVTNTGNEDEPISVGWHPYFALPSGQREQARLYIPAKMLVVVNNYDDVFPTGKLVPLTGKYAFDKPGGLALDNNSYDDCFVDLDRDASGHATAEIIDPAAKYAVRVMGLSPQITAFQAYSPIDKQFVAFEPQFNWGDPFGKEWKGKDTGMVRLKPGQSVTYSVRLEVYLP